MAFLAYCLQVTLKAKLRPIASGITPRERDHGGRVVVKTYTIAFNWINNLTAAYGSS